MKINEMNVVIEPDIINNFYRVTVRAWFNNGLNQYGLQRTYPVDHLRSLFDMIWEDIGKELKEKIMEDDKDVRAGL